MFPNHENDMPNQRILFQQVPQFRVEERKYLDKIFEGRSIEWQNCSPGLTSLDFLGKYLKSKVYTNKRTNMDDLKNRIRIKMGNITPDVIEGTIQSICTHVGGQFEYLVLKKKMLM